MKLNVVSMSGGKDSTATALLAREREQEASIRYVFADTGNEHEATYEYLSYLEQALGISITRLRAEFSAEFTRKREFLAKIVAGEAVDNRGVYRWTPETASRALEVLHPTGNPYLDLCMVRGMFPSRKRQFCTEYLKTRPLTEYMLQYLDDGRTVWSWQGVRADESAARANLPELEEVGGGLWNYRPIHKWTAEDVFAMHRKHGIEPNPLYKQGMRRVGCMPCINAGKDEILEISKRFPEHIDRIERWEALVQSASKSGHESTFIPSPFRERHLDKVGIRAVVQWSKTARGGKVEDPTRVAEGPMCSSAYGLCE